MKSTHHLVWTAHRNLWTLKVNGTPVARILVDSSQFEVHVYRATVTRDLTAIREFDLVGFGKSLRKAQKIAEREVKRRGWTLPTVADKA